MNYLNYQQTGQGPDIILIHGLFGSLENLAMVAKGLSDKFRVTSVDVRNHGFSPQQQGMDYPSLANDVAALMQHLNIQQADILGHSMGGKIAMQLAINHSEKVNRLIVADIAPVQYPPHHNTIINALQTLDLTTLKSRKEADEQLASAIPEAAVRQFLLRNLAVKNELLSFKCHLQNIADGYPSIMTEISADAPCMINTLFIKGGNSDYILPEHREKIVALFPNSKAKVIQGAGHWLHAEKTIAFNKIVHDFLAQ